MRNTTKCSNTLYYQFDGPRPTIAALHIPTPETASAVAMCISGLEYLPAFGVFIWGLPDRIG
jgi:hypothetical protein